MTGHLEQTLQRDFEHIRGSISRMGALAVRALRDCVAAMEKGDRQLAGIVILRDQQIDLLDQEIDRACLEFLLRHQPAGMHLRFVRSAMQVSFELERVGDYAESIGRQILKLLDLSMPIPTGLFTDISSASISMLENAVVAFVRQDTDLAAVTAQIEERVDSLRNQVNSELLHLTQRNQLPLAASTPLMTIARRFERASDQAKSICQGTIFFQTGAYAKHRKPEIFRVLFVDDHHDGLSRLAEGAAQCMARSEFEFASAGIDPRPLKEELVAFLRSKGVNSGTPQRRLAEVPKSDGFHVMIAFSEAARKLLPPGNRNTLRLEWRVPEPANTANSSVQDHFEADWRHLSERIAGLMAGILGEESP